MKRFFITIFVSMIAISILLLYSAGFYQVAQGSPELDIFLPTTERLMEEEDFDNWPGKNAPIRAGAILSKNHFSSLQEAEKDDIPSIYITKDILQY